AVDGSQSVDVDRGPQPLSYAWSVVSAPAASQITTGSLENRFSAMAGVSPDVAGEFILELTVFDGQAEARDQVRIVSTANTPPVANAGADVVVVLGTPVMVDGSGSRDDDGGPQPLSYVWTFVSVPAGSAVGNGSLSGGSTSAASFVPDVGGVYVLALRVSDGVSTHSDN